MTWIVGAGGLGREVLDAAVAAGITVDGFVDERDLGTVAGLPVLTAAPAGAGVVVGIGMPLPRRTAVGRLGVDRRSEQPGGTRGDSDDHRSEEPGDTRGGRDGGTARFDTVIHPAAVLATSATIGPGAIVLAGAVVSIDVVLGPHTQVHYGATVGHDTVLGPFTTVLPGANVAGAVTVGEGVLVGSGAVILQGLTIGTGATIGAGAVVTRDVAPGATVVGVPARPR